MQVVAARVARMAVAGSVPFELCKVSESTLPLYRGLSVLNRSLSGAALPPIHRITCVPGHIAVSFNLGRQICVFDAVPVDRHLNEGTPQ